MDKIICVGKNYSEHVREMQKIAGDAPAEKPVLFLKPPSALVSVENGMTAEVVLPVGHGSVHHECEIVVRLDAGGEIDAVTVGLDMTLRELQTELKKKGQPWEVSKVFAGSAIIGPWVPITTIAKWLDSEFSLQLNGQTKQKGHGREMTLSPTECVAYAKSFFPLCKGDLIFTGTPAGVGPVKAGDIAMLGFADLVNFKVVWR